MQRIRSQTRRLGWSADPDERNIFLRWNPVIRKHKKAKQLDPEAGPTSSPSTRDFGTDANGAPEANAVKQRRTETTLVGGDESQPGSPASPTAPAERTDEEKAEARKKRLGRKIPVGQQIRAVLFPQWFTINWLLFAAPVGIALNYVKGINPLAIFLINLIAIMPLAGILSFGTEEIALHCGEAVGGLLNASFGNAVELIVGIISLAHGQIIITQTSLIGSILSNLLLVLGMSFFFGGMGRMEQFFNMTVAQTAASILALAVGSLLIPTAFTWGQGNSNNAGPISHATAIVTILIYGAYLYFQLHSHASLYNEESQKVQKQRSPKSMKRRAIRAQKKRDKAHAKQEKHGSKRGSVTGVGLGEGVDRQDLATGVGVGTGVGAGPAMPGAGDAAVPTHMDRTLHEDDDEEEPSLSFVGSLVTLCAATALIGLCAEFLIDSISEVTCEYHVSEYWIGLILLPIVGNAAEHVTSISVAIKDKMDLAIGVCVGSSIQIAMMVLPLMVIIGWGMGKDMTYVFDAFSLVCVFISVVLVSALIQDGKSHWFEGALLCSLYVIIATASYFYPKNSGACT
ncbi:calcium/proton exchanger [Trichodelitschia bisporula]|uniref:Calcium/proton exchanger n=1 Tax=Trichodelitschia bisporula TaxID=703511 RepID=A0A6G1HIE2_9PEZI|nr:calcium/proton exchanger [Trichodelitschia bisporula]